MGFTLLGAAAATLIWGKVRPEDRGVALAPSEGGWLERSRASLPPLREHPFTNQVPLLLRPGLLAAILVAVTTGAVFLWFW
jgi:hypothetical protein